MLFWGQRCPYGQKFPKIFLNINEWLQIWCMRKFKTFLRYQHGWKSHSTQHSLKSKLFRGVAETETEAEVKKRERSFCSNEYKRPGQEMTVRATAPETWRGKWSACRITFWNLSTLAASSPHMLVTFGQRWTMVQLSTFVWGNSRAQGARSTKLHL